MFSAALATAAACRKQRSLATWCFSAGMTIFALESLFGAIGNDALVPEKAAFWQTLALMAKSFFPGVWLLFSVTYSRANCRDFVVRSQWLLLGAFSIPLLSLAVFYGPLLYPVTYDPPGHGWGLRLSDAAKILNVLILVSTILILTNIERTFRAAVGTMRWRIKFLVLGLGIVFGARIYTGSQALLFSDRARQSVQLFVSRHFKRPQHDFRQIWVRFARTLSAALDEAALSATASRLISETFGALSVSTWLVDEQRPCLARAGSTCG